MNPSDEAYFSLFQCQPVLAPFENSWESLGLVQRSNDKAQVIICWTVEGKVCSE